MDTNKQQEMLATMKEILQEGYLHMAVRSYTVREDFEREGECRISCALVHHDSGEEFVLEGEGVGTIDAFFNGLKARLADDYPSLRDVAFSQFEIKGLLSADTRQTTQAQAEATVGVLNSEGREFVFTATESSTSRAGMQATLEAVAYFVNSERTFVKIKEILEYYKAQGRSDLVVKYTGLMSEVVKNTSYSEVAARLSEG